jgi:hypothetical protein
LFSVPEMVPLTPMGSAVVPAPDIVPPIQLNGPLTVTVSDPASVPA